MNLIKEIMTNGDLWTAIAGLFMIGLAINLWMPLVKKQQPQRRWRNVCMVGVLIGTFGMLVFAPHPQDAVVRSHQAPLLLSPFENAEAQSTLGLGDKVRVRKLHENYAYVRTPSGAQGWVDTDLLDLHVQL